MLIYLWLSQYGKTVSLAYETHQFFCCKNIEMSIAGKQSANCDDLLVSMYECVACSMEIALIINLTYKPG